MIIEGFAVFPRSLRAGRNLEVMPGTFWADTVVALTLMDDESDLSTELTEEGVVKLISELETLLDLFREKRADRFGYEE